MLNQSKVETNGIKSKPQTPRPPAPIGHNTSSKNELVSKIDLWRKELERQEASQGIMNVFNSICVYLGEQQRN